LLNKMPFTESEAHAIRVGCVVVVGVAVVVDIVEVGGVAGIRRAEPPVVRRAKDNTIYRINPVKFSFSFESIMSDS